MIASVSQEKLDVWGQLSVLSDAFIIIFYVFLAVLIFYGIQFQNQMGDIDESLSKILQISGSMFFLGCALNHTDMATHAIPVITAMDYSSAHYVIPKFMQILGSGVFIHTVISNKITGMNFSKRES